MSEAISFRYPNRSILRSPTFGLPRGTFGRGIYTPQAIILHTLRCSLEAYDAQVTNGFIRNAAEPRHPSLHYAIDMQGNVHQYVEHADVAWGMWDYDMAHFPSVFPASNWTLLSTYPGVTPDFYALHIGCVSGEFDSLQHDAQQVTAMTPVTILQHARLIAYLCNLFTITCDSTHVLTHDLIDNQFDRVCVDESYPYAAILALANTIITAGGETPDPVFTHDPTLEEFFGPFTVGVSRVSSAAYISND